MTDEVEMRDRDLHAGPGMEIPEGVKEAHRASPRDIRSILSDCDNGQIMALACLQRIYTGLTGSTEFSNAPTK